MKKKKTKPLLFFPTAWPLQKSVYPQIEFNAPLRVYICKYLSCETWNIIAQEKSGGRQIFLCWIKGKVTALAGLCYHVGIVPSNEVITQACCSTLHCIIMYKWAIICEREHKTLFRAQCSLQVAECLLLHNSLLSSHKTVDTVISERFSSMKPPLADLCLGCAPLSRIAFKLCQWIHSIPSQQRSALKWVSEQVCREPHYLLLVSQCTVNQYKTQCLGVCLTIHPCERVLSMCVC